MGLLDKYKEKGPRDRQKEVAEKTAEIANQMRVSDMKLISTQSCAELNSAMNAYLDQGYMPLKDVMVIEMPYGYHYVQAAIKKEPIINNGLYLPESSQKVKSVMFINTNDEAEFNKFCAKMIKDEYVPTGEYHVRVHNKLERVYVDMEFVKFEVVPVIQMSSSVN